MHNFFTFRQNSWFRLQLENMNQGWTKLLSRSAWLFARHYLLTTSCSPSASRLVVTPSTLSWKSWSKALVAKRTSPPVSWEESWGEENKTDWEIEQVSENPVMDVKPKCESCGKGFNSEEELNAHKDSDVWLCKHLHIWRVHVHEYIPFDVQSWGLRDTLSMEKMFLK